MSLSSAVSGGSNYTYHPLRVYSAANFQKVLSATPNNPQSRSHSRSPAHAPRSPRVLSPLRDLAITQRGRLPPKKVHTPEPCGDDVGQVATAGAAAAATTTAAVTSVSPKCTEQFKLSEAIIACSAGGEVTIRATEDGIHEMSLLTPLIQRVLDALEKEYDKEFLEFTGVTQNEYCALVSLMKEHPPKLLRIPKLTFLANYQSLIVQCASTVHEAPISEIHAVLAQFQQVEYPRSLVRIQVVANGNLEGELISAIPDLTLVVSDLQQNKTRLNLFILECAFAQTATSVFRRIKELVAARPEVLMVVVVLIDEKTPYHTPKEGSLAWERTKQDVNPLKLQDFTGMVDPPPESQNFAERFMEPVVVRGHTWCSIKRVKYYVWLKKPADNRESGTDESPVIDPDPESIEQSDWSAYAALPGDGADLEHVKVTMNKGIDMMRVYIHRFCEDAARHSNEEAEEPDLTELAKPITLPRSWDHFRTALFDARDTTAHDRYMQWYKNSFRGKKRSRVSPQAAAALSEDATNEPGGSSNKRFATGGQ